MEERTRPEGAAMHNNGMPDERAAAAQSAGVQPAYTAKPAQPFRDRKSVV